MRESGPLLTLLANPPAPSNLGWGCVFTRRWGFRGWIRLLKGKKGRDGGLGGGGGVKRQAAAAYISQCTQRTGHLIYIEPHVSSCSVVFTVVDISILTNKMQFDLTWWKEGCVTGLDGIVFVFLARLAGGCDVFRQGQL